MKVLAQDPRLAREWGHASRRKALDLTPEAGAEKWIRVFDTLLNGRQGQRPEPAERNAIYRSDVRVTDGRSPCEQV
jgi:hypothetical protein